ncbi:MAG: glycerophosphodiester phosphodiesterase [Bacteroidia bacterium]
MALFVYGVIVILGGGLGTDLQTNTLPTKINFAHRGCCNNVPRNCMTAFDKAIRSGNGIETDLRLTKDDILVLYHDDTTDVKLGILGSIADYDYSELLNSPFIYNDSITSERIVSLSQLLKTHQNTPLYIDVKTPTKELGDILSSEIRDHTKNVLVADANILFLSYLKFKNKHIRTVWEGFDSGKEWTYYFVPRLFKPDYLASFRKNVTTTHIEWLVKHDLLGRKIVYGETPLDSTLDSQIPYHIVECD